MNSAEDASVRLARRLRTLRIEGWPGKRITQGELAEAMGASVPLISSWESRNNPKPPPVERLEAYATFFASERSVVKRPYRLPVESQLTTDERDKHDKLLRELLNLRNGTQGQEQASGSPFESSQWSFTPEQDITIVCSELPKSFLATMPYTDPEAPDYVELYRYGDLDALLELFGHIRAANPRNHVNVRASSDVLPDDYTSHLVVLGGVDWNAITAELLQRLDLPVRQKGRKDEGESGGFEVREGSGRRLIEPVLRKVDGRNLLIEDIAHFYRAPNPLNEKRTVTICNGMYQRGTLGAVRALTDARFRDRNEQYLRGRFAGENTFSIVSKVKVLRHGAVTPDWTNSDDLLHEWPVGTT